MKWVTGTLLEGHQLGGFSFTLIFYGHSWVGLRWSCYAFLASILTYKSNNHKTKIQPFPRPLAECVASSYSHGCELREWMVQPWWMLWEAGYLVILLAHALWLSSCMIPDVQRLFYDGFLLHSYYLRIWWVWQDLDFEEQFQPPGVLVSHGGALCNKHHKYPDHDLEMPFLI